MNNGRHIGGFKYRNRRNRVNSDKNPIWGTLITAISGTIINDLTDPNSRIKKLVNRIIHPKQIENKPGQKVIEAEFQVLDKEINQKSE